MGTQAWNQRIRPDEQGAATAGGLEKLRTPSGVSQWRLGCVEGTLTEERILEEKSVSFVGVCVRLPGFTHRDAAFTIVNELVL